LFEASTACADSQTIYIDSSKYCQKPRIPVLDRHSTVLPHPLSAAMASLLREVCGDHYSLPNNELQKIGEEMGKTG